MFIEFLGILLFPYYVMLMLSLGSPTFKEMFISINFFTLVIPMLWVVFAPRSKIGRVKNYLSQIKNYFEAIAFATKMMLIILTFPFGYIAYLSEDIKEMKNGSKDNGDKILTGWIVGTIMWCICVGFFTDLILRNLQIFL